MPDSLWLHGLHCARLPWSSLSPGVCSNSCPLSQWCHSTISSSATPFSSCLPALFPSIKVFSISQLFPSSGQSIGVSALASVLPMNIEGWFPLWFWLLWSSYSTRDSQESSSVPQFESINSSALTLLYSPTLTSAHDYWKSHYFDYTDLC